MKRGSAAALAGLAAIGLGCATTPSPGRCPEYRSTRGVPLVRLLALDDWQRADVAGIAVFTAAGPDATRRPIRDLERFVRLVNRLLFEGSYTPRAPASILIFRDRAQFVRFGGCGIGGHAVRGDDALTLALPGDPFDIGTLQHELVHLLLFNASEGAYPAWFHEGLAEFLHATPIRAGLAMLGTRPLDRIEALRATDPLPLARLLASGPALQPQAIDTVRFYADAWAWVHYGLLSEPMGGTRRSYALLDYASRVARGEAWDAAFEPAFGAPLAEIEAEFLRHRRRLFESAVTPQVTFAIGGDDAPIEFAPVPAAEIAARLGDYALRLGAPHGEAASELFAVALRERPRDPQLLIGALRAAALRESFDEADAYWQRLAPVERDATAAQEAAAELARARYAALDEDERPDAPELLARARAGYERVLRDAPGRQSALVGLGETYRLEPEPSDVSRGIEVLEAAFRADARGAQVRLALGDLYRRAGDYARARLHLGYVAEAWADWDPGEEARELLEELPEA